MIDSSSQLCCRVCVPPRQTACFMKWGNQWRQTAYLLWSCRHAEAASLSQRSTVRYVSRWMRRHSNNKKRGSRADQSSCGRQLAERRKHSLRAAVRSCSKYVCAMFCKLRETTSSDIPPVSCCLRAVCLSLALSDCLRWPRHSSLPLSLSLSLALALSLCLSRLLRFLPTDWRIQLRRRRMRRRRCWVRARAGEREREREWKGDGEKGAVILEITGT